MKILGYGEDALTYWALTTQLRQFLDNDELKDKSDPKEALVIYRPSFGRGVGCFGEFDAIVATKNAVYLVESKWHNSPEVKKRKRIVELRPDQVRRHKAFHWYRSNLTKSYREDWDSFAPNFEDAYKNEVSPELCLPPADSTLRKNLCFVLNELDQNSQYSPLTTNVLLFLSPVGWKPLPTEVTPGKFSLVCLQFPVLDGESYFKLDRPPHNL